MRFQSIALSAAVALSIVASGLALRLQIAHRAGSSSQTVLSNRPQSPATAKSLPKDSPIAADANPEAPASGSASENTDPPPALLVAPAQPDTTQPTEDSSQTVNHLPYEEADPARLQVAGTFVRENFERTESLDLEAANAFILMVEEARAQGINLMPISGFRTVAEQQELFAKQTERYGSEKAAAQLSAPAEYSEHHTGYAIDIGDGDRPKTDLDATFAETPAYQWLLNNAYVFGFEQSFPPGNPQGLSFEPWHWRYVQSERAAQIFSTARGSNSTSAEPPP